MNSLSIYYTTSFNVPAPYSYEVSFEFSADGNLKFDMNYTNRDELTEDEILNEGFTENDDFSWNGKLNTVWEAEIESLLAKTEARNSTRDQEILLKRAGDKFAPRNYKEWNLLIQDLIQAVFETAGKEKEWQMDLQIIKNGKKDLQKMTVYFAKREIDFAFGSNIKMDWQRAKKFMELIYLGDFDETKSTNQIPEKEGSYLCFDQINWYKLGHSIANPHGNKAYLGKLEAELLSLV